MAFRRKTYKRRAPKRRVYKRRVVRKARPAMKKMVRQVISRMAETKSQTRYVPSRDLLSSANGSWQSQNIIRLTPGAQSVQIVINQGVGQGDRIGNKVTVSKYTFKGIIHPRTYDENDNPLPTPQQVRMVLFYDKSTPISIPEPSADLYQLGNSSAPVQNDLIDMVAPFNTDQYRILATKTFKLGPAVQGPTVITDPVGRNLSNNDFKLNCNFSWDITKYVPKIMTWPDADSQVPTSRGLYCAFILARADGTANLAAYIPANVQYILDCRFKDM